MHWRLKRMAVLAGTLAAGLMASSGAFADDAVTTADVNMRTGPGTGYSVVLTLPAGAPVDVQGCSAGWCRVVYRGAVGFVSQSYLDDDGGAVYAPPPVYVPPPAYVEPPVVIYPGYRPGWRAPYRPDFRPPHRPRPPGWRPPPPRPPVMRPPGPRPGWDGGGQPRPPVMRPQGPRSGFDGGQPRPPVARPAPGGGGRPGMGAPGGGRPGMGRPDRGG